MCALALALEGVGVALVNPLTALTYLPLGLQLRRFVPAVEFQAMLVFPPDRPQSDLARRFVATLRRTLEADLAALHEPLQPGGQAGHAGKAPVR